MQSGGFIAMKVSGCALFSCLRKVRGPRLTKRSGYELIWIYSSLSSLTQKMTSFLPSLRVHFQRRRYNNPVFCRQQNCSQRSVESHKFDSLVSLRQPINQLTGPVDRYSSDSSTGRVHQCALISAIWIKSLCQRGRNCKQST